MNHPAGTPQSTPAQSTPSGSPHPFAPPPPPGATTPTPAPTHQPAPVHQPGPVQGTAPYPSTQPTAPAGHAPYPGQYQHTYQTGWQPTQAPPESPKSGNRGLFIALAVLVVALIAGGGIALGLRGGDDTAASPNASSVADDPTSGATTDPTTGSSAADDPASGYSLVAATQSAGEATAVAYVMTVTTDSFEQVSDARIDMTTGRAIVTSSLEGLDTTMIFDPETGIMYMKSSLDIGAETEWVSFDLNALPALGDLIGPDTMKNPFDFAPLFEEADLVTELGTETIDGREMMHYEVVVSATAIEANVPDFMSEYDVELPDQVVYQVYVTDNNELGRMEFDIDSPDGDPVNAVIDITELNTIEPIELPAPSDVTDSSEIFGG